MAALWIAPYQDGVLRQKHKQSRVRHRLPHYLCFQERLSNQFGQDFPSTHLRQLAGWSERDDLRCFDVKLMGLVRIVSGISNEDGVLQI